MEFNDGMIFETRAEINGKKPGGRRTGRAGERKGAELDEKSGSAGLVMSIGNPKRRKPRGRTHFIREMLVILLGYICRSLGRRLQGRKRIVHVFLISWSNPLDKEASDTFRNATCEICTASASLPMLSYVLRRGRLRHCMYDVLFSQVCLDPSNIVLLLRCQQIQQRGIVQIRRPPFRQRRQIETVDDTPI